MRYFRVFINRQREYWTRDRLKALVKVLALFALALVIQHFANNYVARQSGVAVSDFIFDHIPTLDIDFIVVQGALLLLFLIIGLVIWKPRYLLFTAAALSVFIVTRSFFISLTHLGANPHQLTLDTTTVGFGLYNILFNSRSDFFFSGHTGIPFLMGLILYRERFWRYLFFAYSVVMGAGVLASHIHYSIDVFAAPFMTFGIFVMATNLFRKEYQEIQPGEVKTL